MNTIKFSSVGVLTTLLLAIGCGNFHTAIAQSTAATIGYGNLNINADYTLTALTDKYKQVNQRNPRLKGYRIQLLQSDKREEVYAAKVQFQQNFGSGIPTFITHEQPYFRLRIGAFANRYEVYQLYKDIKPLFEKAFIISDRINLRELD
ncbi:MAG: SPOR domain-containing protein [Sphingobacteriales bacterium]|nr:SPOR domain-containing protein [Sphingobacteriales bacterium]